jgi:hypothetical protein
LVKNNRVGRTTPFVASIASKDAMFRGAETNSLSIRTTNADGRCFSPGVTPSDRAATASARLSSRGSRRWLAKLALGVEDRHNAAPLIDVEESLWHCWSEAEPAAEATMDRRADVVGGPEDPPSGSPRSPRKPRPMMR